MVIKVRFHDGSEFFFGSLAAIYEMFSPEDVGCALSTLWNSKIAPDHPKVTSRCVISKHRVFRMKQSRR